MNHSLTLETAQVYSSIESPYGNLGRLQHRLLADLEQIDDTFKAALKAMKSSASLLILLVLSFGLLH